MVNDLPQNYNAETKKQMPGAIYVGIWVEFGKFI